MAAIDFLAFELLDESASCVQGLHFMVLLLRGPLRMLLVKCRAVVAFFGLNLENTLWRALFGEVLEFFLGFSWSGFGVYSVWGLRLCAGSIFSQCSAFAGAQLSEAAVLHWDGA